MRYFSLIFLWCGLLTRASSVADDVSSLDEMWLRHTRLASDEMLNRYQQLIQSVHVVGTPTVLANSVEVQRMQTAGNELASSVSQMINKKITSFCCDNIGNTDDSNNTLLVTVDESFADTTDTEGYTISNDGSAVAIKSSTASGALYGAFKLLSYLQLNTDIPSSYTSTPAMPLRVWDLWDVLSGDVTRGYSGVSTVWPEALWYPSQGPEPIQTYLQPCDKSDPFQLWGGEALGNGAPGVASSRIKNKGAGQCLSDEGGNPLEVFPCSDVSIDWVMNATSQQITKIDENGVVAGCMDVNHAIGPDVGMYDCHALEDRDYQNQKFEFLSVQGMGKSVGEEENWGLIKSESSPGNCITLKNSYPDTNGCPQVDFEARLTQMARFLKSTGVNGISMNDVNACGRNSILLESETLANVTRNIGPIFDKYGIDVYFSACFGSPTLLGNVTCDPLSDDAFDWWSKKVDEVYELMPNFGGFLVKADSEGNIGPQTYNRTEADGANMLARAVAPHGGIIMWRAFVYGNSDVDGEELVRQAYDTFMPLDGKFDDNVVVQIKNGPMDFQIREPLHPLLGAMKNTNVMMEVQAAQEYTGNQIHAVSLVPMWAEYLSFDTKHAGDNSTIANLLSQKVNWNSRPLSGMACVSNFGKFGNWTGNVFAASNSYGFGRLSWDPTLSAEEINGEWARMTFPQQQELSDVMDVMDDILRKGRLLYEGYTSPLGTGFIVFGGYAGAGTNCAPVYDGGLGPYGQECPVSPGRRRLDAHGGLDHYWVDPCSNYGSNNNT